VPPKPAERPVSAWAGVLVQAWLCIESRWHTHSCLCAFHYEWSRPTPLQSRLGSPPKCDQMLLICSAEPRGLCGDPRIFDDLTKVPQVFRNPGGSPALQNS